METQKVYNLSEKRVNNVQLLLQMSPQGMQKNCLPYIQNVCVTERILKTSLGTKIWSIMYACEKYS